MYVCKLCDYITSTNFNYKKHLLTKKHIYNNDLYEISFSKTKSNKYENQNEQEKNYLYCVCNSHFTYKNNFNKHQLTCQLSISNKIIQKIKKDTEIEQIKKDQAIEHIKREQEIEQIKKDKEIEHIKREHAYQLEIERLKHQLSQKDLSNQLEIKEMEHKNLKSNNTQMNSNNIINNTVTNITNVKISKVQYLNGNFSNVIDINTVIENYKTKYGLNNQQAQTLLENYQYDGINGCINSLVHYLKKSAIQQYKEIKGTDIAIENVILPFILSDKSLREHFEKSINGKWDKTTMVDNIKKIVGITNDQVYKHHQQYINITGAQRKRLINGILKSSCFSVLSQVSIPDFYKLKDDPDNKQTLENNETKSIDNQTINNSENIKNKENSILNKYGFDDDDDDDEYDDDDDDDEEDDEDDDDEEDDEDDDFVDYDYED